MEAKMKTSIREYRGDEKKTTYTSLCPTIVYIFGFKPCTIINDHTQLLDQNMPVTRI